MSKIADSKASDALIDDMFAAGVHYGYSKTRRHPSVSSFIYGNKNRTDIIDLEKTFILLKEALAFMHGLGAGGKTVLLVGTKPEAQEAVRAVGEELLMPYVCERWIGGTISNFPEIKKRIAELENYRKESAAGTLEKYTKKERSVMAKKMERLSVYYSGLLSLKKLPDAMLVVDPKAEDIAAAEARKSGIPVIALANSDSNITELDYPILGNDATVPSIKFFVEALAKAYKDGVSSAPAKKEA